MKNNVIIKKLQPIIYMLQKMTSNILGTNTHPKTQFIIILLSSS